MNAHHSEILNLHFSCWFICVEVSIADYNSSINVDFKMTGNM